MNDDISPDIAALLADTDDLPSSNLPSLDDIPEVKIEPAKTTKNANSSNNMSVDLSKKTFKPIEKYYMDNPNPVFTDTAYYKTALSGESEASQRLHNILTKYLTCKDIKDKTVFRQQIVPIYWEFLKSIALKMNSSRTPLCKRTLLRYAVALPSLFTAEQKELFSKVFLENTTGEPIYYLDEWFQGIASGKITLSQTDEVRPKNTRSGKGGNQEEVTRLMQLQTKNNGKLQHAENMLSSKENERNMIEAELKSRVDRFCDHPINPGKNGHRECLSEGQKKLANEITDKLKTLLKIDREIAGYTKDLDEANSTARSIESKLQNLPTSETEVNSADFMTEFDTVRQMAKMTIGRRGNHFPIFTREFYHSLPKGTGFRENVLEQLAWVESLDPGAFCRIHKNVQNRIVPYVILVPTYGDFGFCWEPFDKFNRVTSRGRIVVPMYPKNLQVSVLLAVADLRWQVAKEKASYYWMEEGVTGQYYQWFSSQKLKGDVKEYFINDYILWMTKESEGVQKLDKEVRGIFWRHIPFAQEIKEKLRTRAMVYQELYQRDLNRAMSDGY